jgi:Uncharacterized conserved protein (DUF2190)
MTEYGSSGYIPVYLPGDQISVTASAPIAARDLVTVTGSDQVGPVTVTGQQWIGVAAFAALAGERLMVYGRGTVHEHRADGPVTAGDLLVTSGTAGRGVKTATAVADPPVTADVETSRATCGVALRSAADAALCRWMAI